MERSYFLGTPIYSLDIDELQQRDRLVKAKRDVRLTSQGAYRGKLYGAFHGGRDAGYKNSVETKEGWKPATFVSSRTERQERQKQRVTDFLDEEDYKDGGIGQNIISTQDVYLQGIKNRSTLLGSRHETTQPSESLSKSLELCFERSATTIGKMILDTLMFPVVKENSNRSLDNYEYLQSFIIDQDKDDFNSLNYKNTIYPNILPTDYSHDGNNTGRIDFVLPIGDVTRNIGQTTSEEYDSQLIELPDELEKYTSGDYSIANTTTKDNEGDPYEKVQIRSQIDGVWIPVGFELVKEMSEIVTYHLSEDIKLVYSPYQPTEKEKEWEKSIQLSSVEETAKIFNFEHLVPESTTTMWREGTEKIRNKILAAFRGKSYISGGFIGAGASESPADLPPPETLKEQNKRKILDWTPNRLVLERWGISASRKKRIDGPEDNGKNKKGKTNDSFSIIEKIRQTLGHTYASTEESISAPKKVDESLTANLDESIPQAVTSLISGAAIKYEKNSLFDDIFADE